MLPCPVEPHVILAAETINHAGPSKIDWKRTAGSPAWRRRPSSEQRDPALRGRGPRAPARGWGRAGGEEGEAEHPLGAHPWDLRLPVTNLQDPERISPAERAASAQPRPPPPPPRSRRRRRPRPAPRPPGHPAAPPLLRSAPLRSSAPRPSAPARRRRLRLGARRVRARY